MNLLGQNTQAKQPGQNGTGIAGTGLSAPNFSNGPFPQGPMGGLGGMGIMNMVNQSPIMQRTPIGGLASGQTGILNKLLGMFNSLGNGGE